jgi:uncharacterized MAPEG superfamily protein
MCFQITNLCSLFANCATGLTTIQLFALLGNQNTSTQIGLGAGYTVARILYAVAYIVTTNELWSYGRSLLWWAGNIVCFWAIGVGARGFQVR